MKNILPVLSLTMISLITAPAWSHQLDADVNAVVENAPLFCGTGASTIEQSLSGFIVSSSGGPTGQIEFNFDQTGIKASGQWIAEEGDTAASTLNQTLVATLVKTKNGNVAIQIDMTLADKNSSQSLVKTITKVLPKKFVSGLKNGNLADDDRRVEFDEMTIANPSAEKLAGVSSFEEQDKIIRQLGLKPGTFVEYRVFNCYLEGRAKRD